MTIKRKASKAFCDEPSENSRAICHHCLDEFETTIKTVPYVMADGRPDSKFRQCPSCMRVIPIALTRNLSEVQPLGWKGGVGPVVFEPVPNSRSRSIRNRQTDPDFEVPKFGNREDVELKAMVANGAIITSIEDDTVDSQDMESY